LPVGGGLDGDPVPEAQVFCRARSAVDAIAGLGAQDIFLTVDIDAAEALDYSQGRDARAPDAAGMDARAPDAAGVDAESANPTARRVGIGPRSGQGHQGQGQD
ncbi:hypothetical protein, partial [Acidithiobacillus ferriphilus]